MRKTSLLLHLFYYIIIREFYVFLNVHPCWLWVSDQRGPQLRYIRRLLL